MVHDMAVRGVLEEGMRFNIETGSGHHIIVDSGPQNAGAQPMELLLVGLAGCAAMDIISILRKKRQSITSYEVAVHGERIEAHPRVFVNITVEHILTGHAIQSLAVERAIELTEERYCGASAMLGKTAKITHTFRILEEESEPMV
jgi:putative redox protein